MDTSGDYFAPMPAGASPGVVPAPPRYLSPPPAKPRRHTFIWVALVVALVSCAVLGRAVLSRSDGSADRRAIELPASIGDLPLRDDDVADQARENKKQLLSQLFGDRPSASAEYYDGSRPPRIGFLLVGRGPIEVPDVGDVAFTANNNRSHFGDITCANGQHEMNVLTSVAVCWYSTPTFGASLLVLYGGLGDMAAHAAALEGVIPQMRD